VESFISMNILVTGGSGFIGSNFIRFVLTSESEVTALNLDALTYAGASETTQDLASDFKSRYRFVQGDIADSKSLERLFQTETFDGILNFAAESHVDRSITDPGAFVRTNVVGTSVLLEAARKYRVPRFLQVSTDEVYGSLGPKGKFTEKTPLDPNSPYSASKAGADHLVLATHRTFGQNIVITRCSNNYGPYQHPEKLIPLMIIKALHDQPLPVYGDGLNIRDWIHVTDHCRGIWTVFRQGQPGEVYNLGGNSEKTNLDVVREILDALGKPHSLISFVKDRPGHDRRYAIDHGRAAELNWVPKKDFGGGLAETVRWYQSNENWWRPIIEEQAYERSY
jgi:dTDP-glucose 4,6-dehydratase